jgi:hypothetical protein
LSKELAVRMAAPDIFGGNTAGMASPGENGGQPPVNYNFAHPAFLSNKVWARTCRILIENKGQNAVAPEMPADNPGATFEDDTDAYMVGFIELAEQTNKKTYTSWQKAVSELPRLHLVGESRSADPVLRARERLIDGGFVSNVLRTTIFSSALPYGLGLGIEGDRYTPAYEKVINNLPLQPSGLREMPADVAKLFFLNDVSEEGDPRVAEVLSCLQAQRDVQDKEPLFPGVTMVDSSPITLVICDFDIVHNSTTQRRIAEKHGIGIERIPTGHLPQISDPLETVNFLQALSVQTLISS